LSVVDGIIEGGVGEDAFPGPGKMGGEGDWIVNRFFSVVPKLGRGREGMFKAEGGREPFMLLDGCTEGGKFDAGKKFVPGPGMFGCSATNDGVAPFGFEAGKTGTVPAEVVLELLVIGEKEGDIIVGDSTGSSIIFDVLCEWNAPPGGGGNRGAGEEVTALVGAEDMVTLVVPSLATDGLLFA